MNARPRPASVPRSACRPLAGAAWRWVAAGLCLGCSAVAGTVSTLDGVSYAGRIRMEPEGEGVICIEAEEGAVVRVPLGRLLRADWREPPASGGLGPPAPLRGMVLDEKRGALPSPWRVAEVGRPERPGAVVHMRGTFTVEAWRSADRSLDDGFHGVAQEFQGDGYIVARVASLTPRDERARQPWAGVMLRARVPGESRTLFLGLTGAGGVMFRRWEGTSIHDSGEERRPDLKPPYWLRLTREGSRVSAAHSTDGRHWIPFLSVEESLPARAHCGLAVMSRRAGVAALATFDHVRVESVVPPPSRRPRLVLRDGTVLVDSFAGLGDTLVEFSPALAGRQVPSGQVARILLEPLDAEAAVPAGRTGVLLTSGDFVEGEWVSVRPPQAVLASVLFGRRTYDLRRQVSALVLRPVLEGPVALVVTLKDGSVLRARSARAAGDVLQVGTALAGDWPVPVSDLLEMVREAGSGAE